MTAEELIRQLKQIPKDAKVFYIDGEYQESISEVRLVTYCNVSSLGSTANTVVLK